MRWSAARLPAFLAGLAYHGGYTFRSEPSERAIARAFGLNQQTIGYWKKARREPPMFREFLQAFARKHDLDEISLIHRWEIRPVTGGHHASSPQTAAVWRKLAALEKRGRPADWRALECCLDQILKRNP